MKLVKLEWGGKETHAGLITFLVGVGDIASVVTIVDKKNMWKFRNSESVAKLKYVLLLFPV